MLIYGPSLSLHWHGGTSEPLLRVGVGVGVVRSNWHKYNNAIANNSWPWPWPCPNKLTRSRRRSSSVKSCLSRASPSNSLAVGMAFIGLLSAAALIVSVAAAADPIHESEETQTLSNIPRSLSGECTSPKDCKKAKIQRPKSRKAESCTIKCVTTCIRGGQGSPGEGPLNVRRPLVVFKQGFRTRQYCLVECSDICNLISDDVDDGP